MPTVILYFPKSWIEYKYLTYWRRIDTLLEIIWSVCILREKGAFKQYLIILAVLTHTDHSLQPSRSPVRPQTHTHMDETERERERQFHHFIFSHPVLIVMILCWCQTFWRTELEARSAAADAHHSCQTTKSHRWERCSDSKRRPQHHHPRRHHQPASQPPPPTAPTSILQHVEKRFPSPQTQQSVALEPWGGGQGEGRNEKRQKIQVKMVRMEETEGPCNTY